MSNMAQFFAQRVILGTTKFSEVPAKLRDEVTQILKQNGVEYLTKE